MLRAIVVCMTFMQKGAQRQLLQQSPCMLRPRVLKKTMVRKERPPSSVTDVSNGTRKRRGSALSIRSEHKSRACGTAVTRSAPSAASPSSLRGSIYTAAASTANTKSNPSTNTMMNQYCEAKSVRQPKNPAANRDRPAAHRRRHPVVQAMKPTRGIIRQSSTPRRTTFQKIGRKVALLRTKKVKFSLQVREKGGAYSPTTPAPVPPSLISTPIRYISDVMELTFQSLSKALFGGGIGGASDMGGDSSNDQARLDGDTGEAALGSEVVIETEQARGERRRVAQRLGASVQVEI